MRPDPSSTSPPDASSSDYPALRQDAARDKPVLGFGLVWFGFDLMEVDLICFILVCVGLVLFGLVWFCLVFVCFVWHGWVCLLWFSSTRLGICYDLA